MRLRKPCEHERYERHWWPPDHRSLFPNCPGGEFLLEDALVIEKVEGMSEAEWVSTSEYIKGLIAPLLSPSASQVGEPG